MILDVRTIVVLLMLSSVLMALTLAVGIRTGRGGGFVKWNVGLGLFALGWLLVAARGALPGWVTLALADALLLAGLCAQLGAVIEFGGGRAPLWLLVAPALALLAAALPLIEDYESFTLLVSLAYAAAFGAIAGATLRIGAPAGAARWMLFGGYFAAGAVLLARAFVMLADPGRQEGLFAGTLVDSVVFLGLFAVTATGSTAFLLMLRERAEAEIRHLAMFDPLTELFNRRAFMELAERELARARRLHTSLAVLMLDLDHFKRVNDEFGHQTGDRVLVEFAEIARRCIRAEELLGRYGGEEFCLVLPGASAGQAIAVAERIRVSTCERPLAGLPRATTVSAGVAVYGPGEPVTLDSAIARADEALYRAKSHGRNRVEAIDAAALKSGPGRGPRLAAA
jgi:diguanylate cyclase (GGDEF)-like protein